MVRFVHDTLTTPPNAALNPRVLALGLPRCATSSLQSALETLGHTPCLHMAHVQPSAERQELVTAAALERHDPARRRKLLARLHGGFAAAVDFPSVAFADDLMDLYPDAAVVLNGRRGGAAAWHASFAEGLRFFDSWGFRAATCLVRSDRAMMRMMRATDALYRERWGLTFRDEALYDRHCEWVRDEARRRGRRVLEFVAEDGWAPLCEFLGAEVPDVPYPRMNDQRTMKTVKRFIIARGLLHWAGLVVLLWVVVRVGVIVPLDGVSFVKAEEV